MSDSIQMDGVVFMKYIQISDAGVHIYVAHSAKTYEDTPTLALNLYDLEPDKLSFTESSNRADCDPQYTGHWIEVGKTTFLADMPIMSPMWLQSGMPIFNKVFNGYEPKKDGNKLIYKVKSAKLSENEQAQLKKNFIKKYPKYLKKILANYEANLKAGKYKTLAERIQKFQDKKANPGKKGESLFSVFTGGKTTLPFDGDSLKTARRGKVQEWCDLVDIDYKDFSSMQEAKAALFQML